LDRVALQDLQIERCRMCEPNGWGDCRSRGSCVIKDDFAGVVDRLRQADRMIFATPVYFGDLSESAKAFTDRLRRIGVCPDDRAFLKNLPTLCIAVAGGGGGGATSCMASLEKSLSTPGCFVVDLVPVARRNEGYKAETLRLAGRALAGPAGESWPSRAGE
jgi:multimeric flavodoxin WrbA